VLHVGDVLLVVGTDRTGKAALLVGQEVQVEMPANPGREPRDVRHRGEAGRKRLMDLHVWDRYSVIVTGFAVQESRSRLWVRATLELGDTLRVVGDEVALSEFSRLIGGISAKSTRRTWCRSSSASCSASSSV